MNSLSTARRRTKLRRIGNEKIVEAGPADIEGLLDFTNSAQFDAIPTHATVLYYTETDEESIFDPEGDQTLLNLHDNPFKFRNTVSLALYEELTSRTRYQCKLHPNQELAREQATLELSRDTSEFLFLVYRRDPSTGGAVRQRNKTPFKNPINGIGSAEYGEFASVPVGLFYEYSNDPFAAATIVWQREARLNATIGIIGVYIETVYNPPNDVQQ